jgi:hypothetical protein
MPEPTTPNGSTGDPSQNTPQYMTRADFQEALNGPAAMISRMNKTMEALSGSMLSLDKLAEIGLLEKAADGSFKPVSSQTQPRPADKAPEPEWKSAIEEMKKSLKAKDDELTAERQRASEVEKKNAVISALVKGGAVNPERDAVHILNGIQKNEDGRYISRGKDEYGIDTEIAMEDFVGKFLQQNPELKKATAHAGSGTPAGGSGSSTNTVTRDQMSPEWYARNRDKVISGEIQIAG